MESLTTCYCWPCCQPVSPASSLRQRCPMCCRQLNATWASPCSTRAYSTRWRSQVVYLFIGLTTYCNYRSSLRHRESKRAHASSFWLDHKHGVRYRLVRECVCASTDMVIKRHTQSCTSSCVDHDLERFPIARIIVRDRQDVWLSMIQSWLLFMGYIGRMWSWVER